MGEITQSSLSYTAHRGAVQLPGLGRNHPGAAQWLPRHPYLTPPFLSSSFPPPHTRQLLSSGRSAEAPAQRGPIGSGRGSSSNSGSGYSAVSLLCGTQAAGRRPQGECGSPSERRVPARERSLLPSDRGDGGGGGRDGLRARTAAHRQVSACPGGSGSEGGRLASALCAAPGLVRAGGA